MIGSGMVSTKRMAALALAFAAGLAALAMAAQPAMAAKGPKLVQVGYTETDDGSSPPFDLSAFGTDIDALRFTTRYGGERASGDAKFNDHVTDTDLNGEAQPPVEPHPQGRRQAGDQAGPRTALREGRRKGPDSCPRQRRAPRPGGRDPARRVLPVPAVLPGELHGAGLISSRTPLKQGGHGGSARTLSTPELEAIADPLPEEFESSSVRRHALIIAAIGAVVIAVIVLVPGLGDLRESFADAKIEWLVVAALLQFGSCLSYVAVFRAVFCTQMRYGPASRSGCRSWRRTRCSRSAAPAGSRSASGS